jgi:hypothetical protein
MNQPCWQGLEIPGTDESPLLHLVALPVIAEAITNLSYAGYLGGLFSAIARAASLEMPRFSAAYLVQLM